MCLPGTNSKNKKESITNFKYRTFAMIKPDCYMSIGKIINYIEENGFVITNIKMARLS